MFKRKFPTAPVIWPPRDAPEKDRLKAWYDHFVLLTKNARCWECNQRISAWDRKIGRWDVHGIYCSQAHVLPKKTFKSVLDDLENHLLLGSRCGCHTRFDLSWLSASKMKIWPMAVQIFLKLYPKLTPPEISKLPDILLLTLNSSNEKIIVPDRPPGMSNREYLFPTESPAGNKTSVG